VSQLRQREARLFLRDGVVRHREVAYFDGLCGGGLA